MKGDFTRSTFRRTGTTAACACSRDACSSMPTGRQADIAAHRDEAAGDRFDRWSGGPRQTAGFALAAAAAALPNEQQDAAKPFEPLKPGDLFISGGRFYVDGILCENEHPVTLAHQPDDAPSGVPEAIGVYLAYLDVWQRHLTALDDPGILEVALGGPDTATRTKTVWQVKWKQYDESFAAKGRSMIVSDQEATATHPRPPSYAILKYNREAAPGTPQADGIVVTPSHNPPGDGGFKATTPARRTG